MIIEKRFQIKKIKETADGWLLYPKDSENPVELPKKYVCGKLPPVWKFPWQHHQLNIKKVADFIYFAEMDGLILFDIDETNYSENAKKELARARKIEKMYAIAQEEYIASIKQQIVEYLSGVSGVDDLEDAIKQLPICWRGYLKMRLPMLYQSEEARQRLILTYWLITIANRLYNRYVDTESVLSIGFASIDFNVRAWALGDLTDVLVEVLCKDDQDRQRPAFALYYEVLNELNRVLPPAPKRLEIYMVQTICKLIVAYATDMAFFSSQRLQIFGKPTTTDGEAYRLLSKEMELLKFESFFIEKKFTDEEIKQFRFFH